MIRKFGYVDGIPTFSHHKIVTATFCHNCFFVTATTCHHYNMSLKHFATLFRYLGCNISYELDRNIEEKVNKFQMICGTINRSLKNKTRRDKKIKLYKTMAVPSIIFGSESWVGTKHNQAKIQSAVVKFLRRVKGCSLLDQIRNDDFREELNIFALNQKIQDNKRHCIGLIVRMEGSLVKQVVQYRPQGRRDIGRPMKRWND